jgi:hypothetical protein
LGRLFCFMAISVTTVSKLLSLCSIFCL